MRNNRSILRTVARVEHDLPPTADLPPWLWPRAAYVHVPFCAHHCGYCDFAVATGADDRVDEYVTAVGRGMEMLLREPQPVWAVFIGGGTPTYLTACRLDPLLSIVNHWLPRQAGE